MSLGRPERVTALALAVRRYGGQITIPHLLGGLLPRSSTSGSLDLGIEPAESGVSRPQG